MTSTLHQSIPFDSQQRAFPRREKRPCPGTPVIAQEQSSEGEGDYSDAPEQQPPQSHRCPPGTLNSHPIIERKKPGRKPNPASPAVRKEQNRAAQRAFRDRKERHLQQLENMIQDLKTTHGQATQRFQREAHQLKNHIETLQSENYYLREVVFSFESALSKSGNALILQEVKAELYRRHYEKHSAKRLSEGPAQQRRPSPPTSVLPTTNNAVDPALPSVSSIPPHNGHARILSQGTPPSLSTLTGNLPQHAVPLHLPPTFSSIPPMPTPIDIEGDPNAGTRSGATSAIPIPQPSNSSTSVADPRDETIFSMNSDILYKVPPLFSTIHPEDGRTSTLLTPFEPLAVPKPAYARPGTFLPKNTEYTKHPTVYDELQSSLFPPGTLQALIHSNMATPQEIVNDISIFDHLQDQHQHRPHSDPVISVGQSMFSTSASSIDSTFSHDAPSSVLDSDDSSDFRMATPTLGFDEPKQDIIPSHRLQMEIRTLASAPPATDPMIDPKVYEIPHDGRMDLIPCPKLRAQMILHQRDYDVEELCQLLVDKAKCHGHPLDPHSWELPDAFFDKFGFLLGPEMMRHRNKTWPDAPL